MDNKEKNELETSYKNTIRNILVYAISSILLFATGMVTKWQIFEYIALAAVIITFIYVIYLVYLLILKLRLKK
jgi:predicted membrane channel-forming protein YqfA (hemolysin III family)